MYLIKNAIRNIQRSLGKNILIALIVFMIGFACCLSLSIKQAAQTTKEEGFADLNVTANISYDRKQAMENIQPLDENEKPDKSQMANAFSLNNLSIEELKKYAKAKSVKDFYYSANISLDGSDSLDPIEINNNEEENLMNPDEHRISNSDFTVIGYSSYDAMNDFTNGVKSIDEGSLFAIDAENECIISDELAIYNNIAVGDSITLVNPANENEVKTLQVTGIYTSSENNTMGMQMNDPVNQIYTSYAVVNSVVKTSEANSENEDSNSYITAQINGTYVFDSVEDYESFEEEARALGLDDSYTISSTDLSAYEQSLTPLNDLASYANTFLWVILVFGAMILIVFNIFRLRERKYEIGVLAAIGMNKLKIATQFVIELFTVTLIAIILGIALGSITSVPITNTLLANSEVSEVEDLQKPNDMSALKNENPSQRNDNRWMPATQYISEVTSATNIKVVMQLLGIGLLLTIISGAISIMFILRYEPLRILSDRE